MNTPIALIIYNRPEETQLVIDNLSKVKPKKLYVISDGPKNSSDNEKVFSTRELIEQINWKCDIKKIYSRQNLGCKNRVSSGITEIFKHETKLIILEDDCIADKTFYQFCEELLEKYKDDSRIQQISGSNFQFSNQFMKYSYYFSRFPHVWGWATWRRAWNNYDVDIKLWPEIKKRQYFKTILDNNSSYKYWENIFNKMYLKKIDTWDFQWVFTGWIQNQVSITPNTNLVTNIGFNNNATHTKIKTSLADIPSHPIKLPLNHPPYMVRNYEADFRTQKYFSKINIMTSIIKSKLRSIFRYA